MKKTKKLLATALLIILAVALATSAFAASITVTPAVNGQTYNAYKIFDVTKTSDDENAGYSYTIDSGNAWYADVVAYANASDATDADGLTLISVPGAATTFNVSVADNFSAASFAEYLNTKLSGKTADGTATAAIADGETAAKAEITVATAGYYFVDSSLGALCILNTAADEVTVNEKNSEPTIEKKVKEDSTGTWGDQNDATIGDTVEYQITVKAGGAADTTYVVHDAMSAGLTLNADSFAIKVGGNAVAPANYSINTAPTDGCDFEITFSQAYTATLAKDTQIVITYSAVLNKDAVTTAAGNTNEVVLKYGNTSTVKDETKTLTYRFDLVKTDEENNVIGTATFNLYDAAENGNKIALVKDGDVYRPALEGETAVSIEAGTATIKGLDADTYYLEELSCPAGYTLLDARVKVELTANNNASVAEGVYSEGGVQVINLTGVLLPTTGGIGTTIFYALGGVLVIGALVIFVTKKRMGKHEN